MRLGRVCWALAWTRVSGEEPFGAFGPGEARGHQFTLEHVPWRAVGVAGDLFFADDLAAFGDPVQVTSTVCLSVGAEDLRPGRAGVPAHLARDEFLQRARANAGAALAAIVAAGTAADSRLQTGNRRLWARQLVEDDHAISYRRMRSAGRDNRYGR
jgi:hypothetical protein